VANTTRDKSIPLRVTATEKRTIEKAAKKTGLSTSAYLRMLALDDAKKR
jgi:uncharacterized protein (DUF1778 family)